MPEEGLTEEEIEGLKEIGHFFSVEGITLEGIVSDSFITNLQRELGEGVKVMGLILATSESNDMVFIIAHPKGENKSLLLSNKKGAAEKFYKALSSLKKGEE